MTEEEAAWVRMWPMGEPTVMDAVSRLHRFATIEELGAWADELPESIRADDRFSRAVRDRVREINSKGELNVRT